MYLRDLQQVNGAIDSLFLNNDLLQFTLHVNAFEIWICPTIEADIGAGFKSSNQIYIRQLKKVHFHG